MNQNSGVLTKRQGGMFQDEIIYRYGSGIFVDKRDTMRMHAFAAIVAAFE